MKWTFSRNCPTGLRGERFCSGTFLSGVTRGGFYFILFTSLVFPNLHFTHTAGGWGALGPGVSQRKQTLESFLRYAHWPRGREKKMPRGHTITHTQSHPLIHSHIQLHTFCLTHTHTHTPSLTGPFTRVQQIVLNASCVSSQGITG